MTRASLPKLSDIETKEDKAERAHALLADQKARLELVIAENAFPCTTAEARCLLRQVNRELSRDPEGMIAMIGFHGPNGWGPRVDHVCDQAARHSRMNASAVAAGRESSWLKHWRPMA